MGTRVLHVAEPSDDELRKGIAAIQQEQHLSPEFSAEVERAAQQAAQRPRLPDLDLTALEFLTIDPAGAMDLDQAMHLERDGDGLRRALRDRRRDGLPRAAVTRSTRRPTSAASRSTGPTARCRCTRKVLSEGAASLLPEQDRPAFVWTLRLDATGELTDAKVERARVRSRQQLDYVAVQPQINQAPGRLDPRAAEDRRRAADSQGGRARRGVAADAGPGDRASQDERWQLEYREMLPVESWNAQISLLTGFAAASIMVEGEVGILRTLPPPPEDAVKRLRRTARALGIDWPNTQSHPDFIRGLDPAHPADAAMVVACTSLLRGAGYAAFDGRLPDQTEHAALASTYAHVTAPLRRLVDRYGLEVCAALCAGEQVPAWVLDRHGGPAGDHARLRTPVERLRERRARPGRGSHAADQGRRGVRRRGDRARPRRRTAGHRDGARTRGRGPGLGRSRPLPVGEDVVVTLSGGRPGDAQGAFHALSRQASRARARGRSGQGLP